MAGRGRGGAGKGRGRGAVAPGAAKARRPGAKGDSNLGGDGQDSELLVLGETPPRRPPRASAPLSGGEETGGGSDATGAAKDRSPEAHRDRNFGNNGKETQESELQRDVAGATANQTGVRERNGPATDAAKDRMVQPHGDLDTDGQESEVQVLTEEQVESTNATGTGADEGNGPATDVGNGKRVHLDSNLGRAGEEANDPEVDEEQEIKKGLEELQNLCLVLGMSYERKLLEFGMNVDKERLDKSIDILKTTLANNFCQLQTTANELLKAWKIADTSYKRMSNFAWVLTVRDATRPESVTGKGYLATRLIARANKEAHSIQDEALRKIRDKYLAKRRKLMKILSKSHLVPMDVEFDPNKTVSPDQYKAEKQNLKDCIRKAKRLVGDRKELVLRVELVQNSLKNKASVPFCPALIGDARKTVLKMRKVNVPEAEILFDGVDIDDVINDLEETWKTMQSELEENELKKNAQVKSKTRSGRVPPSSS